MMLLRQIRAKKKTTKIAERRSKVIALQRCLSPPASAIKSVSSTPIATEASLKTKNLCGRRKSLETIKIC